MTFIKPELANELAFQNNPFEFDVVTKSQAPLVVWERVVPFNAAPPLPKFQPTPAFTGPLTVRRGPIPVGSTYQARVFRDGEGDSSGVGPGLLARADYPCVNPEGRGAFLTQCAEGHPQLKITPGGTFVSMSGAAGITARARAQVAAVKPALDPQNLPFFPPEKVVATAVSDDPDFVYRLMLTDELTDPDVEKHTAMQGGQTLFYVVLAWDKQGNFDFVWARSGAAPAAIPEAIKTKQRTVAVRLTHMWCHSDSDDLSDGEATFAFVVTDSGGAPTTKSFTWDPMASGSDRPINSVDVSVAGTAAAGTVLVRVDGDEDDSGSFPPDSDDLASTSLGLGGTPLEFPVGEGAEEVNDRVITLHSFPETTGELLSFSAEISYDVHYN